MIVCFTDFGASGPYLGQMKAAVHRAAAALPIYDLFADAPPCNPRASAYLLAAFAGWWPAGTVFLAIVDPGVGGPRRPLVVEADGRRFVGPDNGLFELVLRRAHAPRAWEIVWRPEVLSASFHGRDLFAPVAARLAAGDLEAHALRPVGPLRQPGWPDDLAEVVYIDAYGNAMTGLRASQVPPLARVEVGGLWVSHASTFSALPEGTPLWFENANGLVELAVNRGRADTMLGLAIGTRVSIV